MVRIDRPGGIPLRAGFRPCHLGVMRSEHKTTADEWDAFTGWRRVIVRMQRAGTRKRLKTKSHRVDRRRQRQRRSESDE